MLIVKVLRTSNDRQERKQLEESQQRVEAGI